MLAPTMRVMSQSKNAAAVGSGGTVSAASTSAAAADAAPVNTAVTSSSSCFRRGRHMVCSLAYLAVGATAPARPAALLVVLTMDVVDGRRGGLIWGETSGRSGGC